jgi:hypothetical protein
MRYGERFSSFKRKMFSLGRGGYRFVVRFEARFSAVEPDLVEVAATGYGMYGEQTDVEGARKCPSWEL